MHENMIKKAQPNFAPQIMHWKLKDTLSPQPIFILMKAISSISRT